MHAIAFTLFDTPFGRCGIAWSAQGICAFQLPESSDALTKHRMLKALPDATLSPAQPSVQAAMDGVIALMQGQPIDLLDVQLDLSGLPAFHQRVYDVTRRIKPGHTLTYGEVAAQLGEPNAARAVGQALGSNPIAVIMPCHRVLAAGGRSGGFSAHGGVITKLRLLTIEQAQIGAQQGLFDG